MAEVAENQQEKTKPDYVGHGTAEFGKMRVGHYLSYTSYLQVKGIHGMNVDVQDERGISFSIIQPTSTERNNLVTNSMHSADTYFETKFVSRTELLEVFTKAGDAVYTVDYRKQVDPMKAFETLKTGNKLKSHEEQKKDLKKALEGEKRTLIGHTISSETGLGRSLVYDLVNKGLKQVDHRTIDSLILKGIKYAVK
jgi:hypothetical protein